MNHFHRYEKKFIIPEQLFSTIYNEITPFVTQDQNNTEQLYSICNIYYDTLEDELIKKSISKPVFKEKLRIRCYGESTEDSIVYLELKKKLHGYVHKSRTLIRLSDATQLIHHKVFPLKQDYHNLQVLNEIYFFVQHKILYPKISIQYDRMALHAIDTPDVRITFDQNIRSRREDVSLHSSVIDEYILQPDFILMEIKTPTSIPLWLSTILTKYKLYSNSFSKYGSEYYTHLMETRKEHDTCLNPYLTSLAQPSQ